MPPHSPSQHQIVIGSKTDIAKKTGGTVLMRDILTRCGLGCETQQEKHEENQH